MSLVPVHGGGALTNRILPLTARKSLLADAAAMTKIEVTDADLSVVYRIADGTLSPLQGFMDEATFNRVLRERPGSAAEMSTLLAQRRVELQGIKEGLDATAKERRVEAEKTRLLSTIRSFFGLDEEPRAG